MKNTLLFIAFIFSLSCFGQKQFVPDAYGHVEDAVFLKLIKERDYELVGGFAPVDNDSILYYARVVKGGKWGFIDTGGNQVIAPQFDDADDFSEGVARITYYKPGTKPYTEYTMGFINRAGEPAGKRYERVGTASYGLCVVVQNGLNGVISLDGKEVIPPLYREIKLDSSHVFVKNEWYYALFNHSGEQLTGFDFSGAYSRFGFLFGSKGPKTYVLDITTGKPLTDEGYDDYYFGAKGVDVLGVYNFKDYFLINRKGERISGYYQRITAYAHGHFIVTKNEAFGVVDTAGREVIPCLYTRVEISEDGKMFTAYKDRAYTYFNRDYIAVDFSAYSIVDRFINGLVYVSNGNGFGFADYNGKLVLPQCADLIGYGFDTHGLAIVHFYKSEEYRNSTRVTTSATRSGMINLKGEVVVPPVYNNIWPEGEVYGFITKKEKIGVLDATGKVIVPAIYDKLQVIKGSGLLRVSKKGLYGIINKDNRIIVPIKYIEVGQHVNANGHIFIKKEGDLGGYVNLQGKIVMPVKYYIPEYDFTWGLSKIYTDDTNYLADTYGNVIASPFQ